MDFELAQVNYSRLLTPLDDPLLADFVAALDPVNAAADAAPGFVWRLQAEDGNATSIQAFGWDAGGSPGVITNMSVWTGIERLASFVYGELHRQILRRRRQWFEVISEPTAACWWVPAGHRPSLGEAEDRIRRLRADGSTPEAFTLRGHYAPPDAGAIGAVRARPGAPDWLCPA